jgi:hypothetical protein
MAIEPSSTSVLLPQFWRGSGADTAVLAAALGHGFQLPAMWVAGRVLRWRPGAGSSPAALDGGFDPVELNQRIARVLELTVPLALLGLSGILALDARAALASALGQGLALLIGLELALGWRRRRADPAQAFARRRHEIVCLILGLGLLVLIHRDAVVSTPLGARLCAFSAALFLIRAILQLTHYAGVWPPSAAMRLGSWGLFVLFAFQSLAYLHAATAPTRSAARWVARPVGAFRLCTHQSRLDTFPGERP